MLLKKIENIFIKVTHYFFLLQNFTKKVIILDVFHTYFEKMYDTKNIAKKCMVY